MKARILSVSFTPSVSIPEETSTAHGWTERTASPIYLGAAMGWSGVDIVEGPEQQGDGRVAPISIGISTFGQIGPPRPPLPTSPLGVATKPCYGWSRPPIEKRG